jgi:hypothetical protein
MITGWRKITYPEANRLAGLSFPCCAAVLPESVVEATVAEAHSRAPSLLPRLSDKLGCK